MGSWLATLRSLARALQQAGAMSGVWARIASLALAALLALAIGGVVSAHARTVGEFIDDTRISAEVTTRLAAESPSNFLKIDVRTETGIVTLSGTVDSSEKRARAAQIAGAVNRVATPRRQLVLTDGSVVRVASSASVHRGTERLTLGQLEPGAEVVIQLTPVPSASPGTTATRPAPETAAALDATDVSVVWTPSTPAR